MCYLGTTSLVLYLTLTITQMTTLKTFYMYKYSVIAAIDENFITNILVKMNIIIISMNTIVRLVLKEYESTPFLAYRNDHNRRSDLHKGTVR